MLLYPHLMAKHCLKVGRKSRSEAWNLPTCGCKSMMDGLIIMLGVFINLLYTYILPNNHYCINLHAAIPPLDGQTLPESRQEIDIFSWSEAWNPPTCGCKSMMDGLTIMLGVFINLLYTYTLPNNHYSTTYMLLYPHLMVKHCLKVGRKSRSEAWNPPTCGCKSMMDGLTIMLGVFINLLYTYILPNNHYCITYMLLYPHLMANIAWKAAGNWYFFLIWGMKPANMWL